MYLKKTIEIMKKQGILIVLLLLWSSLSFSQGYNFESQLFSFNKVNDNHKLNLFDQRNDSKVIFPKINYGLTNHFDMNSLAIMEVTDWKINRQKRDIFKFNPFSIYYPNNSLLSDESNAENIFFKRNFSDHANGFEMNNKFNVYKSEAAGIAAGTIGVLLILFGYYYPERDIALMTLGGVFLVGGFIVWLRSY